MIRMKNADMYKNKHQFYCPSRKEKEKSYPTWTKQTGLSNRSSINFYGEDAVTIFVHLRDLQRSCCTDWRTRTYTDACMYLYLPSREVAKIARH